MQKYSWFIRAHQQCHEKFDDNDYLALVNLFGVFTLREGKTRALDFQRINKKRPL